MSFTFVPDTEKVGQFAGLAGHDVLSDELGVYAASPRFVRENCGPAANSILDSVPDWWFADCERLGMLPNIDVRLHRLNKGEYPAVPGWHCDGALREKYFGQPDLERVRIRGTLLGSISSHVDGVSCPEYVTEPVSVELPENPSDDFVLWRHVHQQIPAQVATERMPDGVLRSFSCDTLHRVMPSHNRGFRLLFRMSMWHNDYLGTDGKVARAQQVHRVIDQETVWVPSEGAG